MIPIDVVIVDDEPLAIERLQDVMRPIAEARIVATASGCQTGIEAIVRQKPNLVLLDIKMRDGTAFDLLTGLPGDVAPMVAFCTAYPRFAWQAFEVNALDYLLKPVERLRLEHVIRRACQHRDMLSAQERLTDLERVVQQLREADAKETAGYDRELWVRHKGTEHIRVSVASITWIGALDDYVNIHANGQEYLLRASLDRIEAILDPSVFTRIHRSTIVRSERVVKVATAPTGRRLAILADGTRLPIGRTYAARIKWRTSPTRTG